jgi:transposase
LQFGHQVHQRSGREDAVRIEAVIPQRSNRKVQIEYDREAYKHRNLVERCVNRIKQFRRIATRYEKTARAYLSMLSIAAAMLWIKTVNTA